MGNRQRDCIGCGGSVGIISRDLCCRCTARAKDAASKQPCPDCGRSRVLSVETGRCILCSRRCGQCGHKVRLADAVLCRDCQRKADRQARKKDCPRCGNPGYLRAETGWCGHCSRPRPLKKPPRVCAACGELRRHAGRGMCSRCWQSHPNRPHVAGEHLVARLADPPDWLPGLIACLAEGYSPGRACVVITELGRLLDDEHSNHPQSLLDRARRSGRSMGSLARSMQDFFTEHGLAMPTDQHDKLAAGRRQRRIDAVPEPLRSAVAGFAEFMLAARTRARRAGTLPRSDSTIEAALAAVRDFASFLNSERGKQDWSTVDVGDVEAFLLVLPKSRQWRITVLRQFFRFARSRRLVLVDPTKSLDRKEAKGFCGRTLTIEQQRSLFRRWTTDPLVHPHEALVGILALLHGASSREARLLICDDVDPILQTVRLGERPHPVPMDPASWAIVQRCLAHRASWRTTNPHVIVTKGTKAGKSEDGRTSLRLGAAAGIRTG
ncbi:integrase [Nocardia sp. NPDC057663]|uniref:integrase n=1 Tax=Nocardia sp. NPDC057663 TaxID=3346201 RepID=UPI00367315C7